MEVGMEFASWDDFYSHLSEWSTETHSQFLVKNSRTVISANRQLERDSRLYSAYLGYSFVHLTCKPYVSTATRPSSRAKSSCPAYIILVADRDSNRLKVKSAKLDHNHQLSLALKQSYPESQRLDDSAKKTALELLSMGIKADDLSLQMSEKKGKHRTRKDVHNLRTTHRHSNDSCTSIELPPVMEGIPRTSLPVTDVSTKRKLVDTALPSVKNNKQDIDGGHDLMGEEWLSDEKEEKQYMMAFIFNKELGTGIGQVAPQVSCAVLGLYKSLLANQKYASLTQNWEDNGQKKVYYYGENSQELEQINSRAAYCGLPTYLVKEANKNKMTSGSSTVLTVFGEEVNVHRVIGTLQQIIS